MNIDPSLIAVSKDGKYVYPIDSVTGHKTFAPIEYFKKMVQSKYGGSVERFVKEYVTRDTKKYLASGYTKEQVKEIADKSNGKLPKIAKPQKESRVPKKRRKAKLNGTTETVTNSAGEVETIKIYPWSNNPDYFRASPVPLDISTVTKNACLRPDIYLDDECFGCPFYELCTNEMKYTIKKK